MTIPDRLAYLRCANPEEPIELVVVIDGRTYVLPQEDRQVLALAAGALTYLAQRRAEAVREGE